jgi:peptidoglycan hydrolase-like protein with peptidoglycan-binding domain
MAKKRKAPEPVASAFNPHAIAQWGTGSILAVMIVYNAFMGQDSTVDRLAKLPPGATTSVEVASPQASAKTITIRYDAKIEEAQRQLLATGHYTGLVDGIIGQRTRIAIETYQREQGLKATGEVTEALLEHMRYLRKVAQASEITGSTSKVVTSAIEVKIARLQKSLSVLGYDPGVINGELSPATRAAIRAFEAANDLPQTGLFSDDTLRLAITLRSAASSSVQ